MPIGANCMIDNFEALQQGYELCNRYGIDTISFGYTLAFAMELFERGIITREDTGGVDLSWGNIDEMISLLYSDDREQIQKQLVNLVPI